MSLNLLSDESTLTQKRNGLLTAPSPKTSTLSSHHVHYVEQVMGKERERERRKKEKKKKDKHTLKLQKEPIFFFSKSLLGLSRKILLSTFAILFKHYLTIILHQ